MTVLSCEVECRLFAVALCVDVGLRGASLNKSTGNLDVTLPGSKMNGVAPCIIQRAGSGEINIH